MPLRSLIRIPLLTILMLPAQSHAELRDGNYFQAISANDPIAKELWYSVGAKKYVIGVTSAMRGIDYPYVADKSITFYGARVDANAQPMPEAIATIPPGATRLLLRFTKLSSPDDRGLRYRVDSFKDDSRTFPFGSFHFINTSTQHVKINLAGTAAVLAPGGVSNILSEPPERGDVSIQISVASNETDNSAPMYTNGWSHRSDLRTLVLLTEQANGCIKPLRYRQTEPSN